MGQRIVVLLLLLLPLSAAALDVNYQRQLRIAQFGLAQGLSETNITDIQVDGFGFVWVATVNGLNRFDGHRFHTFTPQQQLRHGLDASTIYQLLLDDTDTLWALTNTGTFYFDSAEQRFIKRSPVPYPEILSFAADGNELALLTVSSIIRLGKQHLSEQSIAAKSGAKLWYQNKRLMLSLDGQQAIDANSQQALNSPVATADRLFQLKDQTLLVNNDGLSSLDGSLQISGLQPTLLVEHQDCFYLVIDGELYRQHKNSNAKQQLTFNTDIKKLAIGGNGDLWIHQPGQQLQRLSAPDSPLQLFAPSIEAMQLWNLAPLGDDLVAAAMEPQLQRLSPQLQLLAQIDTPISGPKTLCSDGDNLYVGGRGGLYQTQPTAHLYGDHNSIVTTIGSCSDDSLLFGTFAGKVLELTPTKAVNELVNLGDNRPIFVIRRWGDTLLVGSQLGLTQYHSGGKLITQLDNQIVTTIEIVGEQVFVGSFDGWYLLQAGSEPKKLIDKPIYSAERDGHRLYLSSRANLLIFDTNTMQLVEQLGQYQGAQSDYNGMASATLADGSLLFAGHEGINRIAPSSLSQQVPLPKPFISDFRIFDQPASPSHSELQPLHLASKVQLGASEYPFTLEFSDFSAMDNKAYSYRLLGASERWVTLRDHHSATFTALPPGRYQLQYRFRQQGTEQYSPISELEIFIQPPPWRQTSALFAYALVALMLFALVLHELRRRQQLQRSVRESEERLKLSLWGSGDEIWDWDIRQGQIYRSNMWKSLGLKNANAHISTGSDNIHPDDAERVTQALMAHFAGHSDHYQVSYRVKNHRDQWVWLLDRAKVVERDENNSPLRMTGTIKDITNSKQTEQRLSLFELALTNISEGMAIINEQFQFIEVNDACCALTGYGRQQLLMQPVQLDRYPSNFQKNLHAIILRNGHWHGEVEYQRRNGEVIELEVRIDRLLERDSSKPFFVAIFSDITHRKQAEQELRRLSNSDDLTGLPNRSYFQANVETLLDRQRPFSLLLFDLDNFRQLNDTLGHNFGDQLLCMVAERFKKRLPDPNMLYRIGGDEFALLFESSNELSQSSQYAQAILDGFVEPYVIDGEPQHIGASIGMVHFPDDDAQLQGLLRKADLAMYHAKSQGGNCYQFYNEKLNQALQQRVERQQLLRQGIALGWFEVLYQPKLDGDTLKINSMEALVRLRHPNGHLISPLEFIPLAEETGQIIDIGEQVLIKACRFTRKLIDQSGFNGRVAVNLSPKQLRLPKFAQRVEQILQATELPPQYLELEITESAIIEQPQQVIATLNHLRRTGVRLSLDDFGTGYSALSYLKTLPLDTLKIDKSFIDNIVSSDKERSMVDSIITMAHNLELSVVAEGVETTEQMRLLLKMGCDTLQGSLFSQPITEQKFHNIYNSNLKRNPLNVNKLAQ